MQGLEPLYLPCGGMAFWDEDKLSGHRCTTCGQIIGSETQPKKCIDLLNQYLLVASLGGKGWDFSNPEDK